jgi:hypothetical protein
MVGKTRYSFVRLFVLPVALAGTCLFPPPLCRADTVNSSFEDPVFVDDGSHFESYGVGSTGLTGWTVVTNAIARLNNSSGIITPYGDNFLDLSGTLAPGDYGGVMQTISTIAAHTYQVSLALGSYESDTNYAGTKEVKVEFGAGPAQSLTFVPPALSSGSQWGTLSANFLVTSGSTALTITGTSGGQGVFYLGLDDVHVTDVTGAVAAPLPGIALAGSALFSVVGLWRKRGNASAAAAV